MSAKMEPPLLVKELLRWDELRQTSWGQRLTDNWVNIAMLLFFLVMTGLRGFAGYRANKKHQHDSRFLPSPDFPTINEQKDFDHTTTEPIQLRPFKPKYNLTMAIENLNPDELILMDKNYSSRIAYRRNILAQHPSHTCRTTDDPRIAAAVREYYTFLTSTYLPLRYPSMFKLHKTTYESGEQFLLQNLLTNEMFPAFPISPQTSTTTLLATLGKHLDEDILFLLSETHPAEPDATDPKYVLNAFVTCHPSGFDPAEKLGKRLADIHKPVPGYKEKIASSMDRFFTKLEVGKYVKRANWNITTNTELYAAGSETNHAHEGDVVEELKEVDVDKTFLRCERQTLHRLPKSRAIVFSFKTYLYPINQIRDEGIGPDLAEAIEGMRGGNAPGMYFYKRGAVWGEAVKRYLRGESEGQAVKAVGEKVGLTEGEKEEVEGVRRRKG